MQEYEAKSYEDRQKERDEDVSEVPEKCKDCLNCCFEDGKYHCSQVYCIRNEM